MKDIIRKKGKNLYIPQAAWGVCLWRMSDGGLVADADGNYMCAEGMVNDSTVESQMREAAKYWTGSIEGTPHWIDGARKVTDSEREEQEGRLSDGLLPDPVEDAIIEIAPYRGGR